MRAFFTWAPCFLQSLALPGRRQVIHSLHGEQDIRKMGGIEKQSETYMPPSLLAFWPSRVFSLRRFSLKMKSAAAFNFSPWIWAGALLASVDDGILYVPPLVSGFLWRPRQGVTRIITCTMYHEPWRCH